MTEAGTSRQPSLGYAAKEMSLLDEAYERLHSTGPKIRGDEQVGGDLEVRVASRRPEAP